MALKVNRVSNLESLFDKFASLPEDKKKTVKDIEDQDKSLDKEDNS